MVLQQINILGQLLAYFILGYNRGDNYICGSDRDACLHYSENGPCCRDDRLFLNIPCLGLSRSIFQHQVLYKFDRSKHHHTDNNAICIFVVVGRLAVAT